MKIYKKIQKIRKEIKDMEIKKTGENKYSGFKYYELGDFLPHIIDLCDKYELFTMIDFGSTDEATLIIIDTEEYKNSKETDVMRVEFKSSVESAVVKGAQSIQNLGATQTYMRRYLYMNAFEISESDIVDELAGKNNNNNNNKPEPKYLISIAQVNKLFDIAKKNGYEKVENGIKNKYKVNDLRFLTKEQFDAICKGFIENPKQTEEDRKKLEEEKANQLSEELKNDVNKTIGGE